MVLKLSLLSCAVVSLICVSQVQAGVVINEFSPSSTPEWVELFNTESTAVDLTGWSLKDDTDLASHIKVLSGSIEPGGYEIVEHNGSQGWLNNGADSVILKNAEGTIVDSYTYSGSDIEDNQSIGRRPNGTGGFDENIPQTKKAQNPDPEPTPTPTPSPEPQVPTNTPTNSPTAGPSNTPIPTATRTPTPGPTVTRTPTPGPTSTPKPTATRTPTPEPIPTAFEITDSAESAGSATSAPSAISAGSVDRKASEPVKTGEVAGIKTEQVNKPLIVGWILIVVGVGGLGVAGLLLYRYNTKHG